jgi:hypothetical protein
MRYETPQNTEKDNFESSASANSATSASLLGENFLPFVLGTCRETNGNAKQCEN